MKIARYVTFFVALVVLVALSVGATTDPCAPTTTTTTTSVPTTTTTSTTTTVAPAPTTTVKPTVVTMACGTYGSVTQSWPALDLSNKNGTAAAPLVYDGRGCVRLISGGWQVVMIGNASYVTVTGFEIVGPEGAVNPPRGSTSGVEIRNSHHIIVKNNDVHDLGGGGIAAIRSNHLIIDANRVTRTSRWSPYQTSGISSYEAANIGGSTTGYSFQITGNTVSDVKNLQGAISDGNCIIIDDGRWTQNTGTPFTGKTYIARNTCTANGGRGVHVFQSDNVLAEFNTTSGNVLNVTTAKGELTAVFASNVTYRYNTVTPNLGIAVLYKYSATNVTGP